MVGFLGEGKTMIFEKRIFHILRFPRQECPVPKPPPRRNNPYPYKLFITTAINAVKKFEVLWWRRGDFKNAEKSI